MENGKQKNMLEYCGEEGTMIYLIEKDKAEKIEPEIIAADGKNKYWGIFTLEETGEVQRLFQVQEDFIKEFLKNPVTRFESHDGFDIISFSTLQYNEKTVPVKRACIYIKKNLVLFLTDNPDAIHRIVEEISKDASKTVWMDRLLYTFFDRAMANDAEILEEIEMEISVLEDALITSQKKNCVVEIIALRKKLMNLKRHYEHTMHVLEDFQENENELIDNKSMRYLKIFTSRVDRLYHTVLNLRDYVTQVREAYQAAVDINLNNIMKLFTVLTAVFLPLTLLVGWYGMNLQMPEFSWPYGYLFVGIFAAVIAVLCLLYFKKHNWFK